MIDAFQAPFMARALAGIALLALICGPVGVFVFVRRLSFVSDALTHTVFPGVVAGFLVAGQDGITPGALAAGAVTAVALTWLGRHVSSDAATAVVLTAMFSLGVVLVSRRSSYTSDLTSFLFGRLLTVTPRQLAETAVLAAVILALCAILWRPVLFRAFDPDGARAAGIPAAAVDLAVNLLVALVVVASVRAVGTVLVVALLIVPAAAGRLLTDRPILIAVAGTLLTLAAGTAGLALSWTASVDHGIRLTSGSAVVLLLVIGYAVCLPIAGLRRRAVRAR